MESEIEKIWERNKGEAMVELDVENEESEALARRTLVGKVLTKKKLNRNAVKSILVKGWGDPPGLKVADIGTNLFLFTFQDGREAKEVIRRGPWYVMNHVVSLQYWIPEASVYEIDFARVSFWVQLHGLPLGAMNPSHAAKLMNALGEVLEVEDPTVDGNLLRSFMRVRVCFNVNDPLPTGCWVIRKDLPKLWVFLRYEKLQDICFKCGILGHEQKDCEWEKKMAVLDSETPRYGPNLGVPPAKPLTEIVAEKGRWFFVGQKMKGGGQDEGLGETSNSAMGSSNAKFRSERLPEFDQRCNDEMGQKKTMTRQVEMTKEAFVEAITNKVPSPSKELTEEGGYLQLLHLETRGIEASVDLVQQRKDVIGGEGSSESKGDVEVGYKENKADIPVGLVNDLGLHSMDYGLGQRSCSNPTIVDLEENLPRPGLGPRDLRELDLVREDIGLQEPAILLDYLSPHSSPKRYQGAHISQKDTERCKKVIMRQ